MADVVELLAGAHIGEDVGRPLPVALDPAEVALPGVIVYPNTLAWDTLQAVDYDLACDLLMVAGGVPAAGALAQLDELLAAVRTKVPVTDVRAVSLNLPSHSADPLPALQATVVFNIT